MEEPFHQSEPVERCLACEADTVGSPSVEAEIRPYPPEFQVSGQRSALETRSNRILKRF